MDKRNLKKSFLAAALAVGTALSAHATVFLSEDFDSYNTGDLTPQGGWSTAGGASVQVSTAQAASGLNSAFTQASPANGERNLFNSFSEAGASGTPSSSNVVVFSFDFYDTNPTADPYSQFATVQSPVPEGGAFIVYLGLNNNLTAADDGGNYYMAAIRNHEDHAFFKLNEGGASTLRTDDWANLKVAISDTDFKFYVNDVLAKTVTSTLAAGNSYDRVRLGSGVAEPGSGAYYDNINVSTIPEPGTYAAIFGGLALLGAFVYRRRRS